MDAQHCNTEGDAADLTVLHEFLDRFAGLDTPHDVTAKEDRYQIKRRPWLDATLVGGDSGGIVRAKYKSTCMKKLFVKAECHTLYKYLTSPDIDAHVSVLAIDGYGGATNIPGPAQDTAIAQRSSIMKLQWQWYWQDKEKDAERLKFMDDFYTAI
jgi:hypothetical protein